MEGATPGQMRIGRVLQEARERAGLDLPEIERRTKIRGRYLRALENEDWDALPGPAYAKGFLRTYGQLLGIDGEALVDEFRRQVEDGKGAAGYPLGDGLLGVGRRGESPRRSRTGLMLAAFVIAIGGALAVIGLTSGDDEDERRAGNPRQPEGAERRGAERRGELRSERREQRRAGAERKLELELAFSSPVAVCLLTGDGTELIDGQVVAAGSTEGPYRAERFELRFPSGYDRGQFELRIDGERRGVPEALGPTAYEVVAPGRLRRGPEPGPTCP